MPYRSDELFAVSVLVRPLSAEVRAVFFLKAGLSSTRIHRSATIASVSHREERQIGHCQLGNLSTTDDWHQP